MDGYNLILASNSPRRRQLLALGNWSFEVFVSDVDESLQAGETPQEYVVRLAREKAQAAAQLRGPADLIVAADTAVIDGSQVLGKPRDAAEARRMLRQLRGRAHRVLTGLAIHRMRDGRTLTDLCTTEVPMRAYSDEEIEAYVRSGDPLDKAGAYAIQHDGFQPVESMQGCYASVMGLPLCHLLRSLRRLDLRPAADLPAACQSHLDYTCPVSDAILRDAPAG